MTKGILNSGSGAWAFEEHAESLADALWTTVSENPFESNYLLAWEGTHPPTGDCFIPFDGIQIAADRRAQARVFQRAGVPIPETHLINHEEEVFAFLSKQNNRRWVLKSPQSCGGAGHKILNRHEPLPADWPKPYIVQEFIQLKEPEVYRLYCVAGEFFGWNARRFPAGKKTSPWVAHARGARYVHLSRAEVIARRCKEHPCSLPTTTPPSWWPTHLWMAT